MQRLTTGKIFKFWLPLAGTWLMMSVEGPFIAAIIARLADPEINLAAYGAAFAFALIIEAPVIMMMTASTSLVRDSQSLSKLRQFTWILNISITALMLVLLIPKVFFFITIDAIDLPQNTAELAYMATIILLPWPAAIGIRRFYQGVMIRNHATRRVVYGTVIRLISMSSTAVILYRFSGLPGVCIGAAALSAGVTAEAIFTRIMVHPTLTRLKKLKNESGRSVRAPLKFIQISKFYYPLALTSMLTLGVHPMVTFFIGKGAMPNESWALLPVVGSFVFLFRGIGISFQEAAITLLGKNKDDDRLVTRFATFLGLGLAAGLVVIAFTPLSGIWFIQVSGLKPELAGLAITPVMILGIFPALTVLISFQRALLVQRNRTSPITMATIIEVTGILSVLYVAIVQFRAVGVTAAATAFLTGRLAANLYLHIQLKKLSK
jgi:progressive ankylosis protein